MLLAHILRDFIDVDPSNTFWPHCSIEVLAQVRHRFTFKERSLTNKKDLYIKSTRYNLLPRINLGRKSKSHPSQTILELQPLIELIIAYRFDFRPAPRDIYIHRPY